MAPSRRIKSSGDLKTSSSTMSQNTAAHKLMLKLASIEMQRNRYDREYQQAAERMKMCRERCDRLHEEAQQTVANIRARFPEAVVPDITKPTLSALRDRIETRPQPAFKHKY